MMIESTNGTFYSIFPFSNLFLENCQEAIFTAENTDAKW